MKIFRSENRGSFKNDWLDSKYSFSFADWHDPQRLGFGKIRVFNDDEIKPGKGFPMHEHMDMEIVTIVTEGEVTHRDNMMHEERVGTDEIQVMTAGTGIVHSEMNESQDPLKLYQIWIRPAYFDLDPHYSKKKIVWDNKNSITTLVEGVPDNKTLRINQDVEIKTLVSEKGHTHKYEIKKDRGLFIFVIEGTLEISKEKIMTGDSVEIEDSGEIEIGALGFSKAIIIDTPLF